jgi:hypothetical protein
LICEIVTLEFPVLVIVTFCVAEEVPVVTFPKLKLLALMLSVSVAATAVPLRVTGVGEVGALLTIEMLPGTVPAKVGRKVTVMVVCLPAFTLKGSVNPLTPKAVPVAVTWVIVSVAVPVLVMINGWDKLVPTTPFVKLMVLELSWIAGAGAGFTVSVAALLVTVPAVFVTTARNADPLSEVVVAGVM